MFADTVSSAGCRPFNLADVTTNRHAFLFDLDGTLIELAARPGSVRIPGLLTNSLARLAACCNGAVAIVSGRTLHDVDALLAPLRLAGAGLHGLQMRANASSEIMSARTALPPGVRRDAVQLAARFYQLNVEDKGQSVAIHYRACPQFAGVVRNFADRMDGRYGQRVHVQHGKMVAEIRAPGPDKGDAVKALMDMPAFGSRTPLYFGDDLTDEAAFTAAQALGGTGVLVGCHGHATSATARLASPPELLRLIKTLAIAGDGLSHSEHAGRCL